MKERWELRVSCWRRGEGEGGSEGNVFEGREEGGGMMRDVNLEGRDSKEGG